MGQSGTSTTVTQAADPWYRGQASQLYNQGVDFLNRTPYSPYPGSQVAGYQPAQLAAQDFLGRQLFGQSLAYRPPQTYGPFYPGRQTFSQYEDTAKKKDDGLKELDEPPITARLGARRTKKN